MKTLSTEHINLKFFSLVMVFNTFFLVAIFATILFAEPQPSNADTTSASTGSSVYYASISNSDNVTIPVTPTNNQEEYVSKEEDSRIIFSSTCPKGSYVYINTNSTNDNALTRTGSDTGKKTIEAVAGDATSGLTDNTWGFKVNGKAFTQVPVSTSPAVLYESTKVETNTPIDILYGVKVDNNLPSGTYTNDVVYTVAVKPECLAYTLKFDTQGGSAISDTTVNYGDTVDLSKYTTTKANYIFGGWSNGSLDFTGKETAAQPNPSNDFTVTLTAKWTATTLYLYANGNTYDEVTGGYSKKGEQATTGNEIVFGNSYIDFPAPCQAWAGLSIMTRKLINLTDYKYLYARGVEYNRCGDAYTNTSLLYVRDNNDAVIAAWYPVFSTTLKTVKYDISDIEGSYLIHYSCTWTKSRLYELYLSNE